MPDTENDFKVYQCIVNKISNNNWPICDTAYLETLKKVDFKKNNSNKWDGKGMNKGWEPFFNQINIDTLKPYKLTIPKIGNHPFTLRYFYNARD